MTRIPCLGQAVFTLRCPSRGVVIRGALLFSAHLRSHAMKGTSGPPRHPTGGPLPFRSRERIRIARLQSRIAPYRVQSMNSTAVGRFVAAKTVTARGTHYDQTGRWTVTDTANPHMGAFATGHERHMKRWARELNAR